MKKFVNLLVLIGLVACGHDKSSNHEPDSSQATQKPDAALAQNQNDPSTLGNCTWTMTNGYKACMEFAGNMEVSLGKKLCTDSKEMPNPIWIAGSCDVPKGTQGCKTKSVKEGDTIVLGSIIYVVGFDAFGESCEGELVAK